MELLDHKLKVAPTSALVLLQSRSLYDSGIAGQYGRIWYRDGKLMFHQLEGRRPDNGAASWLSLGLGDSLQVGPYALVVEAE